MTRVVFVHAGAGGGHTASANALKEAIEERRAPLEVVPANLQEILFSADFVRRLTGVPVEDFYNRMLRGGVTLGMREMLRVSQLLIHSRHRLIRKRLREHWEGARPSMVVSFIPNFNRALRGSLGVAFPEAPFVTLMTDLSDFPPHFWIEQQDQYLICGTARERERRGLLPDVPTGLVCFGGQGSRIIRTIAGALESSGLRVQLILLCGRDQALAAELEKRVWRIPVCVVGFTAEMPY